MNTREHILKDLSKEKTLFVHRWLTILMVVSVAPEMSVANILPNIFVIFVQEFETTWG